MICRILHLQSEQEWIKASQWLDARFNPGDSVEGNVREILANVRDKGDEALIDYTRRFDCPDFAAPLRVSEQDIAWAAASISPEHREQISEAAHNIRTPTTSAPSIRNSWKNPGSRPAPTAASWASACCLWTGWASMCPAGRAAIRPCSPACS